MWRCPTCRRAFTRSNQAHSCQVVPLDVHLAKASPEVLTIYDALTRALHTCGPYRAVPTKASINLMALTSFGAISLRRRHLNLGLVLTRPLSHARVTQRLQISPRSYAHRVRLESPADVDRQLRAWLREAYAVGAMAGRRERDQRGNRSPRWRGRSDRHAR